MKLTIKRRATESVLQSYLLEKYLITTVNRFKHISSRISFVFQAHTPHHIQNCCFQTFLSLHSGSRSSKTFKPKKNIPEGSHQYELLKHAEATLGSGNLRMAVMLPDGEDLNEWVAVNSKHVTFISVTRQPNLEASQNSVFSLEGMSCLFLISCTSCVQLRFCFAVLLVLV